MALNNEVLIFDTETTGLDNNAEICEIAIINTDGITVFESLVRPLNPIPDNIIAIHGITNEMVAEAPTFADIYIQLVDIFKDKYIIIYNAEYDTRLLLQCALRSGLPTEPFEKLKNRTQCAMIWYSQFRDQSKWIKLTKACDEMFIDISTITAHRALADCKMTLELIKKTNSKIALQKPGILVKYIGAGMRKIGTFEAMVPQATIAKVIVDGKLEYYNIALLEAHMECASAVELKAKMELPAEAKFEIEFVLPKIEFDEEGFKNSISDVLSPVETLGDNLNKETLMSTLANLRKFQKQISDRRIAIVKAIKQPITDFETLIKKGDDSIEIYIAKYDAELKKIVAKEKVAKQIEIENLIPGIAQNNNLDKAHATQLIMIEDYYLAKWTMDKIKIDLVTRAESLFKQQDYERIQAELRDTQIENRTRLIERYNNEFMNQFNFTYANFSIEKFTDEEVAKLYQAKVIDDRAKQVRTALKEIAEIKTKQQMVETPEPMDLIIENETPLIYQNLRLGGASQMAIMRAVNKLKAEGLSVEYI